MEGDGSGAGAQRHPGGRDSQRLTGPAASMRAHVGDRLIFDGDPQRISVVIDVPNDDGSPPYVVRWLSNGHIALVVPTQYTVIVPAGHPAGTGRHPTAAP